MKTTRTLLAAAVLALITGTLAGCGRNSSASAPAPASPPNAQPAASPPAANPAKPSTATNGVKTNVPD